jgi:hypothetical protein
MRDQGVIERLGRGMYRFADMPTLGNPDLATPIFVGGLCMFFFRLGGLA